MVILDVNEKYFSLMYEKAFLDREITIAQIREEILYNIDDIQQKKLKRIKYQKINLLERARLLEKAKAVCRLNGPTTILRMIFILKLRVTPAPAWNFFC